MTYLLLWLALGALGAFVLTLCYLEDAHQDDDLGQAKCWFALGVMLSGTIWFGPLTCCWAIEAAFNPYGSAKE